MPQHTSEKSRQSTRYILAIDMGSGGHKAVVVADTGEVVASADETVTTFLLPDGGAERDPEEWWSGAKKAAKKAIKESRVPPEDIVAVACDSQWSVVVPVDAQGEPLMRAVHICQTGQFMTRCIPSIVSFLKGIRRCLRH